MPENEKDANQEAEESSTSTLTSTEETSQEAENTPVEESSTQPKGDKGDLPFHEHPRFKQLIDEKNELKDQLSQMERILQEKTEPIKQGPTPLEVAKGKLKKLGVTDAAAEELLDAVRLVSDNRVASIEQATVQQQIEGWVAEFARSHEDYEALEPQMFGVFQKLPQKTQQLLASDPMGIQLLYDHVKQQGAKEELKKAREDGVKAGYKTKQSKTSVTSTTGGSPNPPGELSVKKVSEMSLDEYKAHRKEILEAMRSGTLKDSE